MGFTFGKESVVSGSQSTVLEDNCTAPERLNASQNTDFVIVKSRVAKTYSHLRDRKKGVCAAFHIAIIETVVPAKFSSTDLKPDEEVRVIYNTSLISFCISDAHARF